MCELDLAKRCHRELLHVFSGVSVVVFQEEMHTRVDRISASLMWAGIIQSTEQKTERVDWLSS